MKDREAELRREIEALQAQLADVRRPLAPGGPDESRLREREQLYRSLVETSPDSIVLADLSGTIVMANQQAAAVHGFADAAGMLGVNVLELVVEPERERAERDIQVVIETGGVRNRIYTLLRRDGGEFRGEVSASLITDAGGKPKSIIYIGRDVTERERMQGRMLQSQKLESIGTLAGGIAHDFNNLLAVIIGNASLHLRNESLPEKVREALADIMEAAERASALTTQLLAYARGGLQKPVATDLNLIVKAVWDVLRRTTDPRIELSLQPGQDLPVIVADATQIEQVVMNLCLNAIQATCPPGRIEILTGQETLAAARAGELELRKGPHVWLRVRDTGAGMDARTLDRIFEPFFTTRPDGRGMGLPAALGIIRSHKGQIRVHSTPGSGTEVAVWLPAGGAEAQVTSPVSSSRAGAPPHGTETILVIDDNAIVAHTAEQLLGSLGYCVVSHTDTDEALAFLDTNHEDLDLILLNLNMPKHSGPEMLELILRQWPGRPVLLTSGFDQTDSITAMLQQGAAGFVQKPFSLRSLGEAVRRALDEPPTASLDAGY